MQSRQQKSIEIRPIELSREAFWLLAVAAQAIEVKNGQTAIFEPQQALVFELPVKVVAFPPRETILIRARPLTTPVQ
jgi:hypothetical protein